MYHSKLQAVTVGGLGSYLPDTLRELANAVNTINGRSVEQGIEIDWDAVTVEFEPDGWGVRATAYYHDIFGKELDTRSIT